MSLISISTVFIVSYIGCLLVPKTRALPFNDKLYFASTVMSLPHALVTTYYAFTTVFLADIPLVCLS